MLVLLDHRRFVDVIVGRNAVNAGIFGQRADVLGIVPAYIHVEEDHIAEHVLFLQPVLQVFAYRCDSLRKAGFFIPGVSGQIEGRSASIPQAIATSGRNRRPSAPI